MHIRAASRTLRPGAGAWRPLVAAPCSCKLWQSSVEGQSYAYMLRWLHELLLLLLLL